MALIQAQAVLFIQAGQWGTITHHYLLQGNPGPDGIDMDSYLVPSSGLVDRVLNVVSTFTKQAGAVTAFTDYWYNQIFVSPQSQDVGNLSSPVEYTVEVWNGFFSNRVLDNIEELNSEGIILSGGIPAGGTYLALQNAVYTVEVTPDGPPTIDAVLRWVFGSDGGQHTITGNRLVLFAFRPAGPITEGLEWLTSVLRAFSSEQRIANRGNARQTWDMRYKQSDSALQSRLNSAMWGRNFKSFGLPIWTDVTYILEPIPAGVTSFNIDTRFFDYRDGGLILIYRDDLTLEAAEIDTVTDFQINLVRPTLTTFPDGAVLMPLVVCEPSGGLRREEIGNDVTISNILFRAIDNIGHTTTPGVTYLGYEVFQGRNIRPNGQVGSGIVQPQATLDNQTGVWNTYSFRSVVDETLNWSLVADNSEDRWNNKMLFYRMRGRQKPIWFSSYRPDFVVAQTLPSASVNLVVENMGQEFRDLEGTPFHIEIVLKDGSVFYREVIGLVGESSDKKLQTIEISGALGQEVLPEEFERISYLRLQRLNDDSIEIQHQLGIYSVISFQLITVEQPTSL